MDSGYMPPLTCGATLRRNSASFAKGIKYLKEFRYVNDDRIPSSNSVPPEHTSSPIVDAGTDEKQTMVESRIRALG
jgi:hypothetical protein